MQALNRWLLVLVPLLVIGTVAWRYRQNRRQEYPQIVKQGRTEGIAALDEGDFVKAHQLLSAAKSAVNALGGAVDGADEVRQAADEAQIFVDLITEDLGDLLATAIKMGDRWDSEFDKLYKGRSIFIDSVITAVPDGTASSQFKLACMILPPGEDSSLRNQGASSRMGVFDLTGFKLFDQAPPAVGDRKTFGARLLSFKFDKESSPSHWRIRLEPDSGVEILHKKALASIGWQSDSTPPPFEQKEDRP